MKQKGEDSMNQNTERIWLNNNLFQFTDEDYGTNGTVDFSATLSTTDSHHFSPLRLLISISQDNYRKTCTLSFYQVNELLNTINEIMKSDTYHKIYVDNNPVDVERKISNKLFRLLFKKSKHGNDCVLLGIYNSQTDKAVCVVTIDVFKCLISILEQFKNNFFSIENSIIDRHLKSLEINELSSINNSIKMMPKTIDELYEQIQTISRKLDTLKLSGSNCESNCESNETEYVDNENNNINNEQHENLNNNHEVEEEVEVDEQIQEFENFVGKDFENINVPELTDIPKEDNQKETIQQISSDFIEKVLSNNLTNLSKLTKRILTEDCKIFKFRDLIKDELEFDITEPISDKDIKSGTYISELEIRYKSKMYYFNGANYPQTCVLIIGEINGEINEHNKSLAYDLLMIHAYLKNFRTKMEYRTNDQTISCSDFHINLRLFTDVFTYSFLLNENSNVVKNSIISRYKNFSDSGFFSEFDKILDDYNLDKITNDEIGNYVNAVISKLSDINYISELHNELYEQGKVKLPTQNKFSLEQIINEVVPLEVAKSMNLDLDNDSDKIGVDLNKIDDKILSIFKDNKKIKPEKEKQTNLYRFVKYHDNEIPEDYKDEFFFEIKNLGYENFDFINTNFPLNEFGENIIKGLYQWNILDDKKIKYTEFFHMCNETILGKNDILEKLRNTSNSEDNTENDDYDSWEDIIS